MFRTVANLFLNTQLTPNHEIVASRLATPVRLSRRAALGLLGALGAGWSASCGGDTPTAPSNPLAPTGPPVGSACAATPSETRGPFPSTSDLVRSDIRDGRVGAELALTITVVSAGGNCAPMVGAAISIWHCDAAGSYSQYGTDRNESFLRGVQTTDAGGQVRFTTVYPGWYQGRAPHIHLEAFVDGRSLNVTQIAFPDEVSAAVHTSGVYAARGESPTRNAADSVFRDSVAQQTATLTGDPDRGYHATFQLGVAV